MNRFLIVLLIFFLCEFCYPQKNKPCQSIIDSVTNKEVYVFVEKMPEVVGGQEILYKALTKLKYINNYGDYSEKIWVSFIINVDGSISGKRIMRDPTGNLYGNQILKIIDDLEWIPGSCNNKKVSVLYTLPVLIHFK